jgi:xanthine dehydrogenase accessory factor
MELTENNLSFVFGPVGLDIGAETAEEIAVSIIAEIKAVFAGRHGMSLRGLDDVIHSREDTRINERKLH